MNMTVHRLDRDGRPLDLGSGVDATALVWPGMGAQHRSMHHIAIEAGEQSRELRHRDAEATYFVVEGGGQVLDVNSGQSHSVTSGKMLLMEPDTGYVFKADPDRDLICVGGPCPPDPELYKSS